MTHTQHRHRHDTQNQPSHATTSNARLKAVGGPFDCGLSAICGLEPVRYQYLKDNPLGLPCDIDRVGVVAQDLLDVLPDAVVGGEDGYLRVNHDAILFTLVNAVRQLKAQNDALTARLDEIQITIQ
ncbi:MAG TPA: tail fiber domain-containing protein [Phycisphaerales bacterium]|nr:tail fiber domain-containing protein [Phycisphaerales bacterium]